jgi:hypothetical protein
LLLFWRLSGMMPVLKRTVGTKLKGKVTVYPTIYLLFLNRFNSFLT